MRDLTKYIETAIIVDRAMFEKRNGSTRAEIIHDAIQVANIADLVSLLFITVYFIHKVFGTRFIFQFDWLVFNL